MAEISADFRPARMEEIYEIARRLHWKIVQEEEKPFFYHFVYTGEDLPQTKEGKDWSFLVLNEKGRQASCSSASSVRQPFMSVNG